MPLGLLCGSPLCPYVLKPFINRFCGGTRDSGGSCENNPKGNFMDDEIEMACIGCGLIFDPFEEDVDLDDMHCPECGGNNLIGASEI